jgi:multidrug efflux system membrane fusion protein
MKGKKLVFVIVILIAAAGGYWLFKKMTARPPQGPEQGPMPVMVAPCVIQDVMTYNEYTGNLALIESVDIRARVQGFLRRVAFKDGAHVKQGDLLFEIEPEAYQAQRDEADAQLKAAQAEMERARLDLERIEEAIQTNAVSRQDLSRSRAAYDTAAASVLAAQAALDHAELNLSYTRIVSPIDGKISRRYVDAGNLVGASEMTLLANIVKLDPLYVYFNAVESEYLDYRKNVREHVAEEPNKLPVYLSLANEEAYPHQGWLDYMDNMVDSTTGTIQIRGQVPNPEQQLYPGMFVRIRIPVQAIQNAVLVPEKAILTDLSGKYVLTVGENNMLVRRDITLGDTMGQLRVVNSGLNGTERVVVGSFHIAREGMPITPVSGDGPPQGPPSDSTGPIDKK